MYRNNDKHLHTYLIESEQCPTCKYLNDLTKCKLNINKDKNKTPYCKNYEEELL